MVYAGIMLQMWLIGIFVGGAIASNIRVDSIRNCNGTVNPVVSCLRFADGTAITWPPPMLVAAALSAPKSAAGAFPPDCPPPSELLHAVATKQATFSAGGVARGMHGAELELRAWFDTASRDLHICDVAPIDAGHGLCVCHGHDLVWNEDSFDLFAVDPADP